MNKDLFNLCIIILISYITYLIFSNLNFPTMNFREGMTDSTANTNAPNTNLANGIAGNAAAYAAQIKSQVINLNDQLLITKYRSDYENAIMNVDDLINSLTLKKVLELNQKNQQETMAELSQFYQAKLALNNAMKYVDGK